MKYVIVALLALSLAFPSTTFAQLNGFPDSVSVLQDGERLEAFDFEGYRLLLDAWIELSSLRREVYLLESELEECRIEVNQFEESLVSLRRMNRILEEDRQRIYDEWETQNLELNTLRHKPRIGSIVGWSLATLLAVVVLGESLYISFR